MPANGRGHMAVPAVVAEDLVVVQAALLLCGLEAFLDCPPAAASAPNWAWVADFTHVAAWAGTVYVAFVADTLSRRIVGWSAATNKHTELVLAALEMARWQCDRSGTPPQPGELIHN